MTYLNVEEEKNLSIDSYSKENVSKENMLILSLYNFEYIYYFHIEKNVSFITKHFFLFQTAYSQE